MSKNPYNFGRLLVYAIAAIALGFGVGECEKAERRCEQSQECAR